MMANEIRDDRTPMARNAAMAALTVLRASIQRVAPHMVVFKPVHGLLHGLEADMGRADEVLKAGGGADLLDRVRLLLQEADEGQFPVEGGLTAGMVSDMVLAAREASIRLAALLGPVK